MKKIKWPAIVMVLALVWTGCSKNSPMAPVVDTGDGRLSFAMAAADNIASGSVTITKGAITQVLPITITNHLGTVGFVGIQVGNWHIRVQLFDQDGVEIYSGEGDAVVNKDQTTTATIRVNHNTGNLEIIVEVPGDPTLTPTMTETATPTPTFTPTAIPAVMGFNWAVRADGLETYANPTWVFRSGSARGSNGGLRTHDDDPIPAPPPSPPVQIGVLHHDNVWVNFNVSYGVVYDQAPTPSVSHGDYGWEFTSLRQDGFSARLWVIHDWAELWVSPPPGFPVPPDEWGPCAPEDSVISWSVNSVVTQSATQIVSATANGYAEIDAGSVLDIPGTINLVPPHGGTISGQYLVMPGSGDFDDNPQIATVILGSSAGSNSVNFVLRATR